MTRTPITVKIYYLSLRTFFHLLYHQYAWLYDSVATGVSFGMWVTWVKSVLLRIAGPRVLEIGHGPGHLQASLLEDTTLQVFGLDESPQMGKITWRRMTKLGFEPAIVNADAQVMPFPSQSFDQIVATFPSEYIFNPRTLSEIHRLLVPGGKAVILPFAWITGKSIPYRMLSWLYKITGQAPAWDDRWLVPFKTCGFQVTTEKIVLKASTLLLIQAYKPAKLM